MKRLLCRFLALGLLLSLAACGAGGSKSDSSTAGTVGSAGTGTSSSSSSGAQNPDSSSGGFSVSAIPVSEDHGDLMLLYQLQRKVTACHTDAGYYYITLETDRLTDGGNGRHLMYMDFATHQEIFLCSNAACSHNTRDCTSVLPEELFLPSTALFVWQDHLFLLSKQMDQDGVVIMGAADPDAPAAEANPVVLYRAGLDGTGREEVCSFDPDVTVEDVVVGDANRLYFITKKVSTEQGTDSTYNTSSERQLIALDPASQKQQVLFTFEEDGDSSISWDIVGCSGRNLILYGVDFGRSVSVEERHSDDRSIYDSASDVFALLQVDSGSLREAYRVLSRTHTFAFLNGQLFYSGGSSNQVDRIDLETGEASALCDAAGGIQGTIGDHLCLWSGNHGFDFVDVRTGEISHCGLVNRSLGWNLELICETPDQVLVIYDSDATAKGDGSFTIHRQKYGLISTEDLYAGRDQITPIQMIGSGL